MPTSTIGEYAARIPADHHALPLSDWLARYSKPEWQSTTTVSKVLPTFLLARLDRTLDDIVSAVRLELRHRIGLATWGTTVLRSHELFFVYNQVDMIREDGTFETAQEATALIEERAVRRDDWAVLMELEATFMPQQGITKMLVDP
jgi:hypothetical protein